MLPGVRAAGAVLVAVVLVAVVAAVLGSVAELPYLDVILWCVAVAGVVFSALGWAHAWWRRDRAGSARPGRARVLVVLTQVAGAGAIVAAQVTPGVWSPVLGGVGVLALLAAYVLRPRVTPDRSARVGGEPGAVEAGSVEVFMAFDPLDADAVEHLAKELATHDRLVEFTRRPPSTPPDSVGGVRAWDVPYPEEALVRRAVGVLAVISASSAGSGVLRAQLEAAYSSGIPVLGVRVDHSGDVPPNLSSAAIAPYEQTAVLKTIAEWRRRRQEDGELSWPARLRRSLAADRDARR